jgi:hypothetical protein
MDFIAGLVVGSVIGFMFAWFLFSWLTAKSERECFSPERLSQGATARSSATGHDAPGEVAGLP